MKIEGLLARVGLISRQVNIAQIVVCSLISVDSAIPPPRPQSAGPGFQQG